jgi:hypothetical protein
VGKIKHVLGEELSGLYLQFLLARLILALLPIHAGSRLCVCILRLAGFQIEPSCVMWGTPVITGNGDLYRIRNWARICLTRRFSCILHS